MARYRLTIAYDGTGYAGWQIQPNGTAVQEVLQNAVARISGEKVVLHGSGRTDQGVHARRQMAHMDLAESLSLRSFTKSMNSVLPADIRIINSAKVADDFHARHSVKEKEYRYFIWNAETVPPFLRLYRTHVARTLAVSAMREAAALLVGENDFAAFTANPGRVLDSTVRHLTALEVKKKGSEIIIIARGRGFLYKMVRSLAGLIIRIGQGAVPPRTAQKILDSRVRTARVPTAPPEGLFLWNVKY